mmetsp:Transcript_119569/g.381533  ORF Transcript_119569/g.381533 Transcript_119569/m.381533 type:complete len:92 (+) Transcript_119569:42-317(+)
MAPAHASALLTLHALAWLRSAAVVLSAAAAAEAAAHAAVVAGRTAGVRHRCCKQGMSDAAKYACANTSESEFESYSDYLAFESASSSSSHR